jgi:hypothetical protein
MALDLTWPDNLPVPRLSNYSLNQDDSILKTDFSTGRTRVRVLKNRPTTMKATWKLTESEAELFEAALEYAYLGVWFSMGAKLPRMDWYQQVDVLIIKDPRASRKPLSNSAKRWEYSAEILVKKLPSLDRDVYDFVMEMKQTLPESLALLDALEDMLN